MSYILDSIPFTHSLDNSLELRRSFDGTSLHATQSQNSIQSHPFCPAATAAPTLPGHPDIPLTRAAVIPHLQAEFMTPDLDAFGARLWLLATPSSAHVSALHDQVARGRTIVLTENPELHLVWHADRVFIKPLPRALASRACWEHFLCPTADANANAVDEKARASVVAAALGFIRSYGYLVRHESDFKLALAHGLLPDDGDCTWPAFSAYISGFRGVSDERVSARWQFGDLRLSRLNLWAPFFLGRRNFRDVAWTYNAYFTRFYGPMLFIVGIFSVVLSAMQVVLTGNPAMFKSSWRAMEDIFQGFAVFTIICAAAISLFLLSTLFFLASNEALYAVGVRLSKGSTKGG